MRLVLLLTLLRLEATLSARLGRFYKIPGQDAKEEDVDREKSASCLLNAHERGHSAYVMTKNGQCVPVEKNGDYHNFYLPHYPEATLYVKVNDNDPRDFPNLSAEEKQYVINDYLPRRRKEPGIKCTDEEVKSYMKANNELTVVPFEMGEVMICVIYTTPNEKVAHSEYLPASVVKAFDRMGITVYPPIFQSFDMVVNFKNQFVGSKAGSSFENNPFWTGNCMDETGKLTFATCAQDAEFKWPAVCSAGNEPKIPGQCVLMNLMNIGTPSSEGKNEKAASVQVGFYQPVD